MEVDEKKPKKRTALIKKSISTLENSINKQNSEKDTTEGANKHKHKVKFTLKKTIFDPNNSDTTAVTPAHDTSDSPVSTHTSSQEVAGEIPPSPHNVTQQSGQRHANNRDTPKNTGDEFKTEGKDKDETTAEMVVVIFKTEGKDKDETTTEMVVVIFKTEGKDKD